MNPKVLHQISYGVYVITSAQGERINGQIANTVFQITSEPPTLAVSINKQNYTHEFIKASGSLAVNILPQTVEMPFIGRFGFKSGREGNKFEGVKYHLSSRGNPLLDENSTGFIELKIIKDMDLGTHTLFIGEVVECEVLGRAEPLTYADYHLKKGGKSPKTAPTYIKEEPAAAKNIPQGGEKMDKYVCSVCGYVYDPAKGDKDGGIPPGTKFEDLPADWSCPVCGAAKDQFEKES